MIKHLFVVLLCSLPPLCVAQNYQINAGFPMPKGKATAMGGVDINF